LRFILMWDEPVKKEEIIPKGFPLTSSECQIKLKK